MRKTELNELRRLMAVDQHLAAHADLLAESASALRAHDQLAGLISQLNDVIKLQMTGSKATTQTKNAQRRRLADLVLKFAGHLMGVAEELNDEGLQVEARIYPSRLQLMPDEDFAQKALLVLQLAQSFAPVLESLEGVTEADRSALEAELEAFVDLIGSPRMVINRRKVGRLSVPALLKQGRHLLRYRLSRVLLPYQHSAPSFYAGFVEATKLKRVATRGGEERPIAA